MLRANFCEATLSADAITSISLLVAIVFVAAITGKDHFCTSKSSKSSFLKPDMLASHKHPSVPLFRVFFRQHKIKPTACILHCSWYCHASMFILQNFLCSFLSLFFLVDSCSLCLYFFFSSFSNRNSASIVVGNTCNIVARNIFLLFLYDSSYQHLINPCRHKKILSCFNFRVA